MAIKIQKNLFRKIDYITFAILGFLEFSVASIVLFTIEADTKYSFIFGLSKQRVVLICITYILAFLFLSIGIYSLNHHEKINQFIENRKLSFVIFFCTISAVIFLVGWISVFFSPVQFGKFSAYFTRLQPIGIALGLIPIQFWITYWFRSILNNSLRSIVKLIFPKDSLILFIILSVLFVFSIVTKFGVVLNTPLWNVPGIPISNYQMFFVCLFMIFSLILEKRFSWFDNSKGQKTIGLLIPIAIFVFAVLVWGLTPLDHHFFTLRSDVAPDFQPYPYSDARVIDLGAISILSGDGIFFHQSTDKPLYMVLVAIYHLLAGNNYFLIQWIQVLLLAVIPVFVYLLGKKFHSTLFGLIVAILVVIQQRNAILLSLEISSVNVKLLMSEMITLLIIVIIIYLLLLWTRTKNIKFALLLGGAVGVASLIRLNPILLFPAIAVLLFLFSGSHRYHRGRQALLFSLGFLIVFLPWTFVGTDQTGQSFFYSKIKAVVDMRINPILDTSTSMREKYYSINSYGFSSDSINNSGSLKFLEDINIPGSIESSSMVPVTIILSKIQDPSGGEKIPQYLFLFSQHFAHNIITSFMILPDSFPYKDILTTSHQNYWRDGQIWDGNLPIQQIAFIIFNLFLFAVGISTAWKKLGWAGIIPAMVFLIYNLALCISLTSGGRYLVPIDWIVLFYYIYGILTILEVLFVHLGIRQPIEINTIASTGTIDRWFSPSMLSSWIGLFILASLIPIAGVILPKLIFQDNQASASELLEANSITTDLGINYQMGNLYYPYLEKESISFSFVGNRNYQDAQLSTDQLLDPTLILHQGAQIIIGSDETANIKTVYLLKDSRAIKYWESKSLNDQ
ncbi:MAG: hypothetical protein C0410_03440 [Anaerolinea sp.]|nr:hypothetical protein [Anaerolinea sp.]